MAAQGSPSRRTLALGDSDVHVWFARPRLDPEHVKLLDEVERDRCEALRRDEDRARFVTGCALLRAAVAGYRGGGPAAIEVDRTCPRCGRQHGKPRVRNADGLEVSLSHSGDVVAVAAAQGAAVGIDVEELGARSRDLPVSLALSARETSALADLPARAQAEAFLGIWTRKEAVLKATGVGLNEALSDVSVSVPPEPARLLGWAARDTAVATIRLHDLALPFGYVGALAVVDPEPRVVSERDGEELLRQANSTGST
jgi:4'-phosphopantetheinyl transferase